MEPSALIAYYMVVSDTGGIHLNDNLRGSGDTKCIDIYIYTNSAITCDIDMHNAQENSLF